MTRYTKGTDYTEGTSLATFGISERSEFDAEGRIEHENKIEVYGDEDLRDKIIELLNQSQPKTGSWHNIIGGGKS